MTAETGSHTIERTGDMRRRRHGRTRGAHATARVHVLALVVVVAIALLWFLPVFQGKSFSDVGGQQNVVYPWAATPNSQITYPQSDQADLSFPWQSELQAAVRSGTIPWWNPESFGGQPFFANGSSGLLYPPRLVLALTFNATTTHNVLSILDIVLAGVFMYWLLSDLEVGPLPAILGSIVWMFGSFTLGWLQLEVIAPIFAFLPASVAAIRRAVCDRSVRWIVAAATAIAIMLISSHVLLAGVAIGAAAMYGLCLAGVRCYREWRICHDWRALRAPGRFAAAMVLALGLSAFVVLPTLKVIKYVNRQSFSFSELTQQYLFPISALRYLAVHRPLPITADQMQSLAFVGIVTPLLALVGALVRRKGSGLGRGMVIVSFLIAVGGPLTWLAFRFVPGMNVFRPYARLVFLIDFGMAVLAAVGLDSAIRLIAGRRSRPVLGLWSGSDRGTVSVGGEIELPTRRKVLAVGRASSAFDVARPWLAIVLAVAIVAATAVELGHYGRKINPFEPSEASLQYPKTPLITALLTSQRADAWPDRIMPIRIAPTATTYDAPTLYSNESLVFGIDSAGGYDSSVPTRTVDLWQAVGGVPVGLAARTKLSGAYDPAYAIETTNFYMLPRVGVDRIVLTPQAATSVSPPITAIEQLGWRVLYQGKDGTVLGWEGPAVGPTVVYHAQWIPSDEKALSAFVSRTFAYRSSAIIDSRRPAGLSPSGTGTYHIVSTKSSFDEVEIKVTSSAAGWLVVPNMWDPSWRASINGVSTAVMRGDYNEQVLRIPAGTSLVRLSYWPSGLSSGIAISATAGAVAVGILVAPWLLPLLGRRRWRRGQGDVASAVSDE